MQKIGNIECHDKQTNREDPDWLKVYEYMTSLLRAEELPQLGQIGDISYCFYTVSN